MNKTALFTYVMCSPTMYVLDYAQFDIKTFGPSPDTEHMTLSAILLVLKL